MEKLIVIRTISEAKALIQEVKKQEYIAVDTETTGVSKDSQIIGFSVSWDVESGYYVILRAWDGSKLNVLETESIAKEFMEALVGRSLIMQNAVFDTAMVFNNYGI